MNYKEVGFKCGVEIHNRLEVGSKLFCRCDAHFSKSEPKAEIVRRLRPVAGELGQVDVAAAFEFLHNKEFVYQAFDKESCLVEADCEPPHQMNADALMVALQISKILKAQIPDEIHVMRKIVIDGSDTSGFQRTALVGFNGILDTSKGPVRIANISIEEESSGIVGKEENTMTFRLDRLGIPLIEIGTEPDIVDPEHAKEVASKLGMIVRSTGKSQRGLGVTRQDLNVSVKGGKRVEIKGFQDLDMIPQVINYETARQIELVKKGESKEETRGAKADGTTEFMRPLPGGGRMYPETDIPPIVISHEMIAKIPLPEPWEAKLHRFKANLSADLAEQILYSEYLEMYEKFSNYGPTLVATFFTSMLKDLRRKGVDVSKLGEHQFRDIFESMNSGKITKELLPEIIGMLIEKPEMKISQMGIKTMGEKEVRDIVTNIIKKNPGVAFGGLMGDVMREVSGRVPGSLVKKILEEELKK